MADASISLIREYESVNHSALEKKKQTRKTNIRPTHGNLHFALRTKLLQRLENDLTKGAHKQEERRDEPVEAKQ